MAGDQYKALSEDVNKLKSEPDRNGYQHMPKENKEKIQKYGKETDKLHLKKINKKERTHERKKNKLLQQYFLKKDSSELKSADINVVTNFIRDKVESFFDTAIYTDEDDDDDDCQEIRIIGFIQNACGQQQNISNVKCRFLQQ